MSNATARAFLDAIQEENDQEEFERLMLGTDDRRKGLRDRTWDALDMFTVTVMFGKGDEATALESLRAERSLEALRERHPELWEQVSTSLCDA